MLLLTGISGSDRWWNCGHFLKDSDVGVECKQIRPDLAVRLGPAAIPRNYAQRVTSVRDALHSRRVGACRRAFATKRCGRRHLALGGRGGGSKLSAQGGYVQRIPMWEAIQKLGSANRSELLRELQRVGYSRPNGAPVDEAYCRVELTDMTKRGFPRRLD